MKTLVRLLQRGVRDFPTMVLGTFAVLALAAGLAATQLRIDPSVESLMSLDDPDRALNRSLKRAFSNDEVLVVALDIGRPLQSDDLRKLNQISRAIAGIEGVEEVLDLSTIEDVRGSDGLLDATPLVDLSTLDRDFSAIRERVREHRLYHLNLVNDALDVLAIIVVLELPDALKESTRATTREIRALLEREAAPWTAHLSGYPANEYEADRIARRDVTLLTPPAFLAILLVIHLAARRRFALVLVTVQVLWSELVMAGWLGLSGTPLNIVTSSVPPILLATSATYAIYLLGLLERVSRRPAPGVEVIELVTRPALLSALSTAAAFLSLRLLGVQSVAELGTVLTVGILASAVGTLLLLPALVHRYDLRLDPSRLPRLGAWSQTGVRWARHPGRTLGVALILVVVALPGVAQIGFDSDPMQYFSVKSSHREGDRFVRERLAGTGVVNVHLETGEPDGALEPEVMELADAVIREVESSRIVDRTVSFLDYIYLMDAALRPGETPRTVLPSRELAAQYMLVYELGGDSGDYRHYVNHDRSGLNVFVRTNSLSSSQILALRERIQAVAEQNGAAARVHVLGSLTLLAKAMDRIARGMVTGLLTALLLVFAVMALTLRSLRLAFVAILPNAAPIVICGGVLGWLGIPLSVGTSVVGCVALGLAVDDTAHVLGHVERGRPLSATYRTVGKPILLTSLSLGLGFGILMLSEFQPVVVLGAATTLTLGVALLFDLLVLPSLLAIAGYEVEPAEPA